MDEYTETNRRLWDAWTDLHAGTDFYDVEAFKGGKCTLDDVDVRELGDVADKSLLHLQCHFGLDTLSWARRGAKVTGADFSPKAVALGRCLADELGIDAEFVCSDLYALPQNLTGQFDIVYTSAGVLAWLRDIRRWAEVVAHFLKPEGLFYIREFHPFMGIFDETDSPTIRYPYFHSDEPIIEEVRGSYADRDADVVNRSCEWFHSLSDIINALLGVGMQIEYVHEFPYCTYQSHPFLRRSDDGMWRCEAAPGGLPLMFSIRATAPAR